MSGRRVIGAGSLRRAAVATAAALVTVPALGGADRAVAAAAAVPPARGTAHGAKGCIAPLAG